MSYLKKKSARRTVGFLVVALGLLSPQPAQAFTLRSLNFFVKFGQIGVSQASQTVVPTPEPAVAGEFAETGHSIFSGYSYNTSLPRLTLQVSEQQLGLGTLAQGMRTVSHVLQLTTNAGGYALEAVSDHLLRQPRPSSAAPIPATTCDTKCLPDKAGPWSSGNRPGFGFSVLGEGRSSDFENAQFFRPLSDRENGQFGQRFVSSNRASRNDVFTLTYKVISSSPLANGTYQTRIAISALAAY